MEEKLQKIAENAQKQKKKRIKYGKSALKRQYPRKITGIFVISCLKTRKSYVGRSRDVELAWNTIKGKLRRGEWTSPTMQEDYDQYGLQWFRFNVVAGQELLENMSLEEIWPKVLEKSQEVLADMRPAYNYERIRTKRYMRRKRIEDLGMGRPAGKEGRMVPPKAWNPRGIYVLTCKKNKRQFVGMATNFHETAKQIFRALAAGTHKNPAVQEDYNQYGDEAFLVEYCELPEASGKELTVARKEIALQLNAFYNEFGERLRREKIAARNKEYRNARPYQSDN